MTTNTAENATAGVPVVRGLKWRAYDNGSFWASDTTGLAYQAVAEGWLHRDGRLNHVGGGIEAAKAAAQADFDWRITAAINPDFLSELDTARAEIERLTRDVNKYAYERDKAREERDAAERRSEGFWKPQLTAAQERIAGLEAFATRWRKFVEATFAPVNARAAMDELGEYHELTLLTGQVSDLYDEALRTLSPAVKEPM